MNTLPVVTIVTVCYQAAKALEKTILSVSQQDYQPLEYIVVDGASTDNTPDIITRYQNVITQWVSEPDRGIYDAMNKAVTMATGEWIIFMNAGDTFAASDVLIRIFSAPQQVDVIYGSVVKDGRIVEPHRFTNPHRMPFCHQSALTRTVCLREFPFDINHRMSADLKFFKQLLLAGRQFQQVPFPIAVFDTAGVSNAHRSAGLADNIRIIREVDNWRDRLRLLPRLFFVYFLCRIKGK